MKIDPASGRRRLFPHGRASQDATWDRHPADRSHAVRDARPGRGMADAAWARGGDEAAAVDEEPPGPRRPRGRRDRDAARGPGAHVARAHRVLRRGRRHLPGQRPCGPGRGPAAPGQAHAAAGRRPGVAAAGRRLRRGARARRPHRRAGHLAAVRRRARLLPGRHHLLQPRAPARRRGRAGHGGERLRHPGDRRGPRHRRPGLAVAADRGVVRCAVRRRGQAPRRSRRPRWRSRARVPP